MSYCILFRGIVQVGETENHPYPPSQYGERQECDAEMLITTFRINTDVYVIESYNINLFCRGKCYG